ncbi:MAG: DNA-directed RNA polymerase subunit D [Candidatus Aenigmarchaeota archaeon]|nr:DNA-directed RNA polymerase subunit D [Candidatus Aenigmarchaeota archaeon]MDI6722212.1 DNA-directed RNA polymerase subunit D [Candidatus Aenigmarchaeota archaeon]
MKLKILEKTDTKMKFILEDASPAFANALRRIMMNETPTIAVENVYIEENTSGMFDEMLAHRLGLVPLTAPKKFNFKEGCKCDGKGCNLCEVTLIIDKQGPCIVKAGDMKSTNDEVRPSDDEILVTELLDGQRIRLEGVAQLGYGKNHVKWQASIVGYRYMANVKIYPDRDKDVESYTIDVCPTNVFEKKDGTIKVARPEDCNLCMRCFDTAKNNAAVVTADEKVLVFRAESVSGRRIDEIFMKSLEEMESRTEDLISSFKKAVK